MPATAEHSTENQSRSWFNYQLLKNLISAGNIIQISHAKTNLWRIWTQTHDLPVCLLLGRGKKSFQKTISIFVHILHLLVRKCDSAHLTNKWKPITRDTNLLGNSWQSCFGFFVLFSNVHSQHQQQSTFCLLLRDNSCTMKVQQIQPNKLTVLSEDLQSLWISGEPNWAASQ